MIVVSPANARVKRLVSLRKRRDRDEAGVTLVEGFDEIVVALAGGAAMRELYFCRELMVDPPGQLKLLAAAPGEPVEMSRAAFERAAYRESPDGWLAVFEAPRTDLGRLRFEGGRGAAGAAAPLLLVCESVEKPGNLGAMLRTADAAGVDAVISAAGGTDWSNPNVARASKGTVLTVPVAETKVSELLPWLRAEGVNLVAATPSAEADFTEVDLTGPVAIAVGTEHEGLTDELMDAADIRVRIPMSGKVNSLNVATSAALLLYEAVRQRGAKKRAGR